MHDRSDAEDAVQSAFRKAFQHREQFQGNGRFVAWLGRIVKNECLMRICKERSARLVSLDYPTESNIRLELISPTTSPEDELGGKELLEVWERRWRGCQPSFEISCCFTTGSRCRCKMWQSAWGVSVPAAKSRLTRARRELRSRFGKSIADQRVLAHCSKKPHTAERGTRIPASSL